MQFFIAVYGGYFGGGIGLMMMAALTMTGVAVRNAGAAKNILAGVINASAVAIFVFSRDVHWLQVIITAIGASFGGWAGALDAETCQREAPEARRRRDRRRADDRPVLEGALGIRTRGRSVRHERPNSSQPFS